MAKTEVVTYPSKEYEGHFITVAGNLRFTITGPLVDTLDHVWADSYEAAKKKIDDLRAKDRQTKKAKLNLPVYNLDGKPETITGLYAGRNTLLGVSRIDGYGGVVYPRVPWIVEKLAELQQVQNKAQELRDLLSEFQIDGKRSTYGRSAAYEDMVADVVKDHAAKTAKAETYAKKAQAKGAAA